MIVPFPAASEEEASLGRRIGEIRAARGLTVERLADEARLWPARVFLAEEGRVRLNATELHALINALRIPLGLLFGPPVDLSRLRRF